MTENIITVGEYNTREQILLFVGSILIVHNA